MSSSSSSSDDLELLQIIMSVHQALGDQQAESLTRANRRYLYRDRLGAGERLIHDYFEKNPTYPAKVFKRRFRMSKRLFLRIIEGISDYSLEPIPDYFTYFKQRVDCRGVLGFSIIQKCTSAIRQLAYGTVPDALDEYLQMAERTSRECLENFCKCIIHLYAEVYMRNPTPNDIQRLYAKHEEKHGFPGMLGSIDCMHWAWDKCPVAWQGQYTRGDQGRPTIMLEAVASYDMWIWHAFFGVAGSNNDINVLNQSSLFDSILNDTAPEAPFDVNGRHYTKGYYLADGIYPSWAIFVQSFSSAHNEMLLKFKRAQESARKDIERIFGVLQGRFAIVRNPSRAWSVNKLRQVMYTCCILHNMITEDNGFAISDVDEWYVTPEPNIQRTWIQICSLRRQRMREIRDNVLHSQLRQDLIEHIW